MKEAKVSEIFKSLQGEGPYTGTRQVFIRFFGCTAACAYCDTKPEKFDTYNAHDLVAKVMEFKEPYNSISITGGEPLEQADFLADFIPLLKEQTKKTIYLETNGILPDNLSKIIDNVDIIAMDVKLPTSTEKKPYWAEHERFLGIAKAKQKEIFVKVVVTWKATQDEIYKVKEMINRVDPKTKVILQPVDPISNIREPSKDYLNRLKKILEGDNKGNVKVMPQAHKQWGVK